jgi:hypothetical protein
MMTTRPRNDGNLWTTVDLRKLKRLAKDGTVMAAARAMGRTPAAIQQMAIRSGISFRSNLPRMDEQALIRAALITLRRAILQNFPRGLERKKRLECLAQAMSSNHLVPIDRGLSNVSRTRVVGLNGREFGGRRVN